MTVSSTENRKQYAGNGATTSFATSPVVFFVAADLTVYIVNNTTGAVTNLTLNTHYTVSGGGGSTGTVNLAGGSSPHGALLTGTTLVIVRDLAITQASDFVNNDSSDAEVAEDALDRLTMIAQQLDARLDRSIAQQDSDTINLGLLPNGVDRASKTLGFDAAGALTVYAPASAVTEAANVTVTQSGSGATSETVQAALRRFVHSGQYNTTANFNTARQALTGTFGVANFHAEGEVTIGDGGTTTNAQVFIAGAFSGTTGGGNYGLNLSTTITVATGMISNGIISAPTFAKAASGTHGEIASIGIRYPTITGSGSTVTNSYGLLIGGGGVGAGATNHYGIVVEGLPSSFEEGVNILSGGAYTVSGGDMRFGSITRGTWTNFAEQLRIISTASSVNYLTITGSTSGSGTATIGAGGSDGAIGIIITSKGNENLYLMTNGGTVHQVRVVHTAFSNRHVTLTGSNGGNPAISVSGGELAVGTNAWTLGAANAVSPTSPNRTLTVTVGGTTYYIHAKTTND